MRSLFDRIAARIDLRPRSLLRFALIMLIMVSAGPETFAAWELRLLLELLGATLFLTAYFSALRLLAAGAASFIRDAFVPATPAAMLLEGAGIREKCRGAVLILARVAWVLGGVIVLAQWGKAMLHLFA